ncbi:uncharacterized protein LOC111876965 [Lactuca sativa]|uniref:DUF7032 domain-containing protein n=1 Tax=Lactuca sativa TaxID=4236 RepID=A0A9R1WD93_LACSA|nr:uncharacterized protein LOC111876965 [Lactuca sativa]KAJ0224617.1 hypothetical protein LSAT_V11C100047950 [Lactuca sativa]
MVEENTQLAGNSKLRLPTDQISSLITLSHSIRVFASRWNLIRNKLNEILPILAALPPELQDSVDNPTLSGVIQAVEETTEFTTNLAQKCIDLSYSGKLLMQSDLDIICVKFNNHIKSLSELSPTNGLSPINGDYALVVSRPERTASKDDIKFYVKDLLSRFRIGSNEIKKRALICFNEVIHEDERFVKIAMDVEGFAFVLVELLVSKESRIQEEALKTLDILCGFDSYKCVLVSFGVIAPLIRVLESGTNLSRKLSTSCLMKCTSESDNAWSVSAHGGVTSLLKISGSEYENDGELVSLACGVLKNLVGVSEIKRFMVEEGAIPMFINLVNSTNELSQITAIDFLQSIASKDELVTNLIVKEGGIHVLSQILDPQLSFSSTTREISIMAIMNLCSNSTRSHTLITSGFLDHILYFLNNSDTSVQESSLKAAFWLSGISDDFKKAMGDKEFMQELVKLIGAKSFEVREMASETLSNLVSIPKNRKKFVENDQNVGLIMQSVDQEDGSSSNRKLLLPIIMSLSGCNSGRKKILSSGYLKNIEKLADEQVSDARKIVRNLTSNRFVRMIRGFWR